MSQTGLAPGQFYGNRWIIYSALSEPVIRAEEWHLKTSGLVEKPLDLSFEEMQKLPQTKFTRDFQCLLPNTIVYANPEPKEIQQLSVGDAIIGSDGRKHTINRLIRKQHSGKVIGVKASYLPSTKMTPDHPVWAIKGDKGSGKDKSKRRIRTFSHGVNPEWTRADELTLDDYVFFPKYREISGDDEVFYEGRRFCLDEKFAYLLGWYIAEGSGSDSEGRGVAFSLSSKEIQHLADIRSILKELVEAKTSVYTNPKGTAARIVVTSCNFRHLNRALKQWCGNRADTKKIPDFIMNAKPEVLKSCLRAIFEGDGYSPHLRRNPTKYEDFIDITTISRILAYQLVLAFSKLEMPADVVDHPGSVRTGYSVRLRGSKIRRILPDFPVYEKINKFHYWETEDGFFYPIRKIWSKDYAGEVMDFQAPGYTMLSPFVTQDCVTKWSIKDVTWDGVAFSEIAKMTGIKPEAKWVMFHCADGYTAPVPLEDAMADDSVIAFKMNGRDIPQQQGYPCRPFIAHLYGWKSAKWMDEIEFLPSYVDGYWEMYGYNERGDIWDEERFKGHEGKHSRRRTLGFAPI